MKEKKEILSTIKSIVGEATDIFFSAFWGLMFFGGMMGLAHAQYNPSAGTSWKKSNDWIVFVHGWDMSEEDNEQYSETMFKRLYHAGYTGHFTSFRWPTHEGKFTFNDSEYRAWKSGESLKDFVAGLPSGTRKHIIAHSLGNIVVASALEQGMTLSTYIMMQAAVAGNCYGDAPAYSYFTNRERRKPTPQNSDDLGYGLYLQSTIGNVQRTVNCYNPQDYALATGTKFGINISWEKNQRRFRPEANVRPSVNYIYRPHYSLKQRCFLVNTTTMAERSVTDPHESMAFISRARAKAIGADNTEVFENSINLSAYPYGFGDKHPDHSGQFLRPIQKVLALYKEILGHIYREEEN